MTNALHLDRPSNEANHRTSAYEALAALITHSAADSLNVVSQVVLAILSRQEQLLGMQNQILGVDDRSNWNELQSNFCSILVVSSVCNTSSMGEK